MEHALCAVPRPFKLVKMEFMHQIFALCLGEGGTMGEWQGKRFDMKKTTHFKVKIYIWPLHLICKQKAEMLMPEEE